MLSASKRKHQINDFSPILEHKQDDGDDQGSGGIGWNPVVSRGVVMGYGGIWWDRGGIGWDRDEIEWDMGEIGLDRGGTERDMSEMGRGRVGFGCNCVGSGQIWWDRVGSGEIMWD